MTNFLSNLLHSSVGGDGLRALLCSWYILGMLGCSQGRSDWPNVAWMRQIPIREDIRGNLLRAIPPEQAERVFSPARQLEDAQQGFILFHVNFGGSFDHAEWDRGFTLREPDLLTGGLLVVTWNDSDWMVAGDVYPTGFPNLIMPMPDGAYAFQMGTCTLTFFGGDETPQRLQRRVHQLHAQPAGHAFGEGWSHGGTVDILYVWNREKCSWTIIVDGLVEAPGTPMMKFTSALQLYEELIYLQHAYFAAVPKPAD